MASGNDRMRILVKLMSVLVSSLALSACGGAGAALILAPALGLTTEFGEPPAPLAQAGRIQVHTTAFQHEVSFSFDKSKLSPAAAQRIDAFMAQSRVGHGDRVRIVYRPISGAAYSVNLASARGRAVAAHLSRYSVPIELASDVPSSKGGGKVSVVVIRRMAFANTCREWEQGVIKGRFVDQWSPLGCLNDMALAAMVADPSHLVDPTPMGPANSEYLGLFVDRYRQGKAQKPAITVTD